VTETTVLPVASATATPATTATNASIRRRHAAAFDQPVDGVQSPLGGRDLGRPFRRLRERLVDGDRLVGGVGRRLDLHVDVPGVRAVSR